tara:strand:+ start:1501 stop:2070 length:570 start_codon:yes stop_codon:yes gene_type:complete
MKLSLRDHRTEILLKQRVILAGFLMVMMLSNVFLVVGLVTKKQRWILIPQFDINREMALTTDSFSDEYLAEWAMSLCEDFLTVNPYTVEIKKTRFLQIAARPSGDIQDSLAKMVSSIKQNKASTVFYPKKYHINRETQTIQVTGLFLTYLGRTHRPVSQDRTFLLKWMRGPHGVLLLEDMVEEKGEQSS